MPDLASLLKVLGTNPLKSTEGLGEGALNLSRYSGVLGRKADDMNAAGMTEHEFPGFANLRSSSHEIGSAAESLQSQLARILQSRGIYGGAALGGAGTAVGLSTNKEAHMSKQASISEAFDQIYTPRFVTKLAQLGVFIKDERDLGNLLKLAAQLKMAGVKSSIEQRSEVYEVVTNTVSKNLSKIAAAAKKK